MSIQISRRSIFDIWIENSKHRRMDAIIAYILEELGTSSLPDNVLSGLKVTLRSFCQKIEERWTKSGRNRGRFLSANLLWLQANLNLPDAVVNALPSTSQGDLSNRTGRPQKAFEDCGSKTKKRKVKVLVESSSQEELTLATEIKLRKAGKRDSASIVKELSAASPTRGTTIKKARESFEQKLNCLSADQALALIVDANLSTNQYNIIRQQVKCINNKLYPPYYKVKEAKKLCYPTEITITEISSEIKLQSLIDHTVKRLCQVQEEVLLSMDFTTNRSLTIIIKWGCDGAEQNRYKQKFSEEQNSDGSLFSFSMVPIQIYSGTNDSKKVIWQNPAPSSTRHCRPIKFLFAKESVELITTEVRKVDNQITTLMPTKILVNGIEVMVKPILVFCMVDGKVCNAVSSCSSTQKCYLCGAKPREMNNMNIISQKVVDKNFLSFGLSPLHSWIRFLECVLHISYRLNIKTWQVRGTANKNEVAQKKKYVQDMFKSEFGWLIDMPKQQTGNTNDGNTARAFFRNAEKSAEITGVNLELIKRFRVILECLNCGFQINLEKFDVYTKQTLELYLKEYPWYSMPVSVHKILCHGKDILTSCILPIGQFSEEAQEARNKHSRQYRELFTRKTSRLDTNTDLLHRLLISSDPFIASLRARPKTKRGQIIPEVLELLEEPHDLNTTNDDNCGEHSDSD